MSHVSYPMSHVSFLMSHGLFTVPQQATHRLPPYNCWLNSATPHGFKRAIPTIGISTLAHILLSKHSICGGWFLSRSQLDHLGELRWRRNELSKKNVATTGVLPSLSLYMTTTEEAEGHANASGEPMRFGEDVLRLAMRPFGLDELLRSHQEVACYPPL